ncbi:MAG TPA: DNA polymerase III subunit delta [Firmicutes bacterium]|jgi:DNA polymerase-3 subunit delta|nr:DNA polymerase III subunit delta [Bacillota bacterium]
MGKTAPVYLVYGDEAYWHDRLISLLSNVFPDGTEHISGDEATWPDIAELLVQPSFFGPRLWIVRGAKSLFDQKPDRWIDIVAPGNCLLLSSVTRQNPAPKGFNQVLDKLCGRLVHAAQPSFRDASSWARGRIKTDGYSITREALENLIVIVGRSIERLEKEVEKLELFVQPSREIAVSHVLDCVSPDPEMNTFAFVDAVATGNTGKAFSELEDLRARGVNPVFMIAVLGSHFGLMWRAKEASLKGITGNLLGRTLGVHPYSARKALEQSRNWTFPRLEKALRLLCSIDESLKSGTTDPVSAMDYVLINLTQR